MVKKQTIIDFWEQNINENMKTISTIIFLILTKIMAIVIFGLKLGLDPLTIAIVIYFAVDAYIVIWMRVIFTGEVSASKIENDILQQKLILDEDRNREQIAYMREISEYRVTLAALKGEIPASIMATADWNILNDRMVEIERKIANNKTPEEHIKSAIKELNMNIPKADSDKLPLDKE